MKFEEDLHDELDNLNIPTVLKIQIEENVLSMKKEHCLDKMLVKEAVMRLPNDNRRHILMKELRTMKGKKTT